MNSINLTQYVASVFKNIATKFTNAEVASGKEEIINVNQLLEYIDSNREMHRNMVETLSSIKDFDRSTWLSDKVPNAASGENECLAAYHVYLKSLNNKASRDEAKSPFTAIIAVNKTYGDAMLRLSEFIKSEYDGADIKSENLRVSTAAIMGLIGSSEITIKYTSSLFTSFVKLGASGRNSAFADNPKYRNDFMAKYAVSMGEITNGVYDSNMKLDIFDIVTKMRKRNGDMRITPAMFGASSFMTNDLLKAILNIIGTTVFIFFGFITIVFDVLTSGNLGLSFSQWLAANYEQRKETREWMRQHVALLRMELEGINPDDPRYRKLEQVIAAYDERITEYDYQIAKYERELDE